MFSNILHIIVQQLKVNEPYVLLYGNNVNPYYHIKFVKTFIINNVLYLNIMLLLQHVKGPIMKFYKLKSDYLPTNMSLVHSKMNSYTKLDIEYPYIAFNCYHYATLNIDFDRNMIKFDNLHVPRSALLIFKRQYDNCYLNIMEHVNMKDITITCPFQFHRNITVKPTSNYYLMNVYPTVVITCEVDMASSKLDLP